jgi:hypothetical protein
MHPFIVAHEASATRTVVQIDTQQLPSPGSGSRHIVRMPP